MIESDNITPSGDEMSDKLHDALKHHLLCTFGYGGHTSELNDANYLYRAAAATIRDRLSARWRETRQRIEKTQERRVHYLSLEFLLGRSLNNAALNLELEEPLRNAIQLLG